MVVVLIIAILLAIAIPTYIGAQNRARDRAAQSDLRNALVAARTIASDHDGFFQTAVSCPGAPIDAAALNGVEGALQFTGTVSEAGLGPPSYPIGVTVNGTCNELVLVRRSVRSGGNNVFCIAVTQSGLNARGVGQIYPASYSDCSSLPDW